MKTNNYTKKDPCPICGGDDWCGWSTNNKRGIKYVFCHRTMPPRGTEVNGYICIANYTETSQWESIEDHENNTYKKGTYKKPSSNVTRETDYKPVVNLIADVETRHKAYFALLKSLKLEEKHRKYLHSEGWNDEMISRFGIVSLPPKDKDAYEGRAKSCNPFRTSLCKKLVDSGISLKHVPGFQLNQKGKWTFNGNPGIVFPCFDINRNIFQLRIRPDYTQEQLAYYKEIGKKPPKYVFFSSSNEYGGACNEGGYSIYLPTCGYTPVCFITEGEKKGIVIASKRDTMSICVQGVGCFGTLFTLDKNGKNVLQYLKKRGVEMFVLAYDADKHSNMNVLNAEKKLIEALKKEGFSIAVCEWNLNIAKGIDDLIMLGLNPSIYPVDTI